MITILDENNSTDLSKFENSEFNRGASKITELFWMILSAFFFQPHLSLLIGMKLQLLKKLKADIGKGVIIKPKTNIKFPWKLSIGNHTWIGENVWIDNLAQVTIGNNVCISQGAMLLTGNHNYKKSTFDLIVKEIIIEDGAWIGAKSVVCPGVKVGTHAVLTVGSVATHDLEPYTIYQGNPAKPVKKRIIHE